MYLLIVTYPLLAYCFIALFGRFFGKKGSVFLSIFALLQCLLVSLYVSIEVLLGQSFCYIKLIPWVQVALFELNWGLAFDSLTAIMLIVVVTISTLVHLYSAAYMQQDPHLARFMAYLSLFTFFMLVLITSDNFIQLFVGWEGVGLCSYLLINFWYLRISANKAAIKAMLMNRVGDLGFCLGLFSLYLHTATLEFSSIFASIYQYQGYNYIFNNTVFSMLEVTCLCLFIGAVGKSAQIGLHTWLPDAMEGPTPVSALIHAATMVTAGVFLIIRCSYLFELAPTSLFVVALVGATTAFFAATIGVFQNDLKKVIAYSTCSQLGYMVFACGLSNYQVSIFHLANHAFFKALLFLSAGSIIHALANEQDMRKMGGLLQILPFSYVMICIGSLALMGTPFLTGFYSKDYILEYAYSVYSIKGTIAFWLGCIAAMLTSFYSIRLAYMTFIQRTNSSRISILGVHEAPMPMAVPLAILALASVFLGYLWRDVFIGGGTHTFGHSLYISSFSTDLLDAEFIPFSIKSIPIIFSLLGSTLSFLTYIYGVPFFLRNMKPLLFRIYKFYALKWYIDTVYSYLIGLPSLKIGGNVTFLTLDKGFIELFGPFGLMQITSRIIKQMSTFHTGLIHHYILYMMFGIGLILVSFGLLYSFGSFICFFFLGLCCFLYILFV
jgi:proton-translocating NADH-quinone oxidoreductase chain L